MMGIRDSVDLRILHEPPLTRTYSYKGTHSITIKQTHFLKNYTLKQHYLDGTRLDDSRPAFYGLRLMIYDL